MHLKSLYLELLHIYRSGSWVFERHYPNKKPFRDHNFDSAMLVPVLSNTKHINGSGGFTRPDIRPSLSTWHGVINALVLDVLS